MAQVTRAHHCRAPHLVRVHVIADGSAVALIERLKKKDAVQLVTSVFGPHAEALMALEAQLALELIPRNWLEAPAEADAEETGILLPQGDAIDVGAERRHSHGLQFRREQAGGAAQESDGGFDAVEHRVLCSERGGFESLLIALCRRPRESSDHHRREDEPPDEDDERRAEPMEARLHRLAGTEVLQA